MRYEVWFHGHYTQAKLAGPFRWRIVAYFIAFFGGKWVRVERVSKK